jgi:hypothetical protein
MLDFMVLQGLLLSAVLIFLYLKYILNFRLSQKLFLSSWKQAAAMPIIKKKGNSSLFW